MYILHLPTRYLGPALTHLWVPNLVGTQSPTGSVEQPMCTVSIVRPVEIPSGLKDPDSTWRYVTNLIWMYVSAISTCPVLLFAIKCSIIETYTDIICACLPSLKAFAKHHFPNMFRGHVQLEPAPNGVNIHTNITPELENREQHCRVEV